MKLEVGKFYTVRDPEEAAVIKVRVDALRDDLTNPRERMATTVFFKNGDISSYTYTIYGTAVENEKSEYDLVAEYKEPKKLVKWYRPSVYWDKSNEQPKIGGQYFGKNKDITDWFKDASHLIKVLKWDEIEAPETWEQCE